MSANVTEADKTNFLQQSLNDYIQQCEKSFEQHKFECAEAGLTIGHTIITEFLWKRISDTPQGQKVSANNEDIFTMLNVLAKTNATALTSLKRAKYHEDQTRTLTANLNSFDKKINYPVTYPTHLHQGTRRVGPSLHGQSRCRRRSMSCKLHGTRARGMMRRTTINERGARATSSKRTWGWERRAGE